MALTPKQEVFVNEYLATWNATEAARRAGYAFPNQQGPRLLVNIGIAEEIKQRIADKVMTADEVLVRLAEQARNEHGNYITATGLVDLPRIIRDGKGHLIKGIKETQYGKNIEFYDAQAALVHIGKHHGLFKDVSEVKAEIELKDVTDLTDEELASIAAGRSERTAEA